MTHLIDRRRFLRGAGGVALSLPLLNIMNQRAFAQNSEISPRFVVLYFTNGTVYNEWIPTGQPNGGDYQLGPIMQDLAPHKDDLTILTGVHAQSAIDEQGNAHNIACGNVLTGVRMQDGGTNSNPTLSNGASIDHAIADQINAEGMPLRSVHFGVRTPWEVCFTGAAQPIDRIDDPVVAANYLFGDSSGINPQVLARLRHRRTSVIDTVKAQIDRLRPQLGNSDRSTLDNYLSRVRDLERRMTAPAPTGPRCVGLPFDNLQRSPHRSNNLDNVPQFHEYYDVDLASELLVESAVQTIACARSPVVTIAYGDVETYYWLQKANGQQVDSRGYENWHELIHAYWANDQPNTYLNPELGERISVAERWRHGQIARLIQRLKEIPEGEGTALDNTIILYANEFGDATHVHTNMPFFIAGGRNLGIRQGQWLNFDGVPHNRLFMTLLRAFGSNATTFGDPDYCSGGVLPGLLA